jgi:hypothetical protein
MYRDTMLKDVARKIAEAFWVPSVWTLGTKTQDNEV